MTVKNETDETANCQCSFGFVSYLQELVKKEGSVAEMLLLLRQMKEEALLWSTMQQHEPGPPCTPQPAIRQKPFRQVMIVGGKKTSQCLRGEQLAL